MKVHITLRTRLVMLVLAAIVPLFGLSIIKAVYNAGDAVDRATTDLQFAASLAASSQQRLGETARQVLTAIVHAPDLRQGERARCDRYLATLVRQFPLYANLGVINAEGQSICSGIEGSPLGYLGDRAYFRDAMAYRTMVIGEYIVGRASGKPSITFALPLLDAEGRVLVVAYAAVDLAEMAKSAVDIQLPPGAALGIHDHQGVLLAGKPDLPIRVGQKAASPVLRDAVRSMSRGTRDGPDAKGQRRLWAFMPSSPDVRQAFFVAVSLDHNLVVGGTRRQLGIELVVLALVASLGGLLAWLIGGRAIVLPTRNILEATKQIQDGRLDVRIPAGEPDDNGEFARISAGFNRMAESLQKHRSALEGELANSEAIQRKLQDAQRLGRIGYWQLDLDSHQAWWSDEIYDVLGVDIGSLDGSREGFMGLIHPADREDFVARRDMAVQAGEPLDIEFRIVTAAGEIRWIHMFGREMENQEGSDAKVHRRRSGVLQEITHRKVAEQALVQSEQRYAALFEMAPAPMWVFDVATTRFLTVNKAAVDSYGYSAAEFLSMTLFEIRPDSDRPRLARQLEDNSAERRSLGQHRRKDGSVFSVNVMSRPIQYAGKPARFVVALDVTAQLKAERDVQEHLFTLQRAADAAQAITWHQTLEGTMHEVAEQARGVVGSHQAIVSLTVSSDWAQAINALSLSDKYAKYRDLIEPPDGTGIYAMVCQTNRSMRMTQAELEAHPRWRGFGSYADKHPPMRGWLAVPLTGRDGKNIGVMQLSDKYEGEFTQQDEYVALELAQLASIAIENARLLKEVSELNTGLEQKVAERTLELERQQALFQALAEQAPQVVWTSDPDGAATYFNRAWFDLVGGAFTDWAGNGWYAAIHPDDVPEVHEKWKAAVVSQAPYAGIRRLLAKDGSCHTMSYRASPVLDEQGGVAFWVGIDADITEVKAIESALRLSNQELEAFSYSVSHDLRSPLNTVDGFSRLLAKQLQGKLAGSPAEKVSHYLSRIQAGVAQMGQLIEDLLSLAQVSRAPLTHKETVDLSALAHTILDEWQARYPDRKAVVHIEKGLKAHGDSRLVRVLMENLLGNAWKFSAQQAVTEITVGRQLDAAGLPEFFVRDNGAGFDMAYVDKLFVPFQRLHAAAEFPGTGIGLATVSRVVKRHGGRLWTESAPGKGATFFFTLPKTPKSG